MSAAKDSLILSAYARSHAEIAARRVRRAHVQDARADRNVEIIRLRDTGSTPYETAKALGTTQGIVNKVYADAIEQRRNQEGSHRSALLKQWSRPECA